MRLASNVYLATCWRRARTASVGPEPGGTEAEAAGSEAIQSS
jgi:hypothetical protein